MNAPRLAPLCLAAIAAVAAAPTQRQSGLDPSSFDRAVRPEDDLYRFANGGWLDSTAIPDERVVYTAATEIQERVDQALRTIVEEIAAEPAKRPGSPAQQIGDLYTSMIDSARIEALGAAPLAAELARIDAIATTRAVAAVAGHLSATSTAGPFFSTPVTDARTGARVIQLSQGGLLLPDREYYLSDAGDFPRLRREYRSYLAGIFRLVNRPAADADADAVLALETALARAFIQPQDRTTAPAVYTLRRLADAIPRFDWEAWARPQGIDRAGAIVVMQPPFFRRFAELLQTIPLDAWRAWLAGRYITAMAPYVSDRFAMARFAFFGRTLTGQQAPRPRWRRGIGLVNDVLADEIGRLYVARHFPATSRARVRVIVDHVVRAYTRAVAASAWLSAPARREAFEKLARLSSKIGYPDRWRRYRGLDVRPDDLVGNMARAQQFANAYRMSRLRDTAGRDDWLLPPQTVNAYYSPAENEIVFPAAILQPPYFTASADDAVNFGAIGAVIGHEIGHALDERGRRYDARGAARDWWTQDDERAYATVTRPLVEQYSGYEPQPGARVDGVLTLAENASDLAGLAVAFAAYRSWLDGRPAATIDGLTGDQRFFLGWARIWRARERDEYQRQMLFSSPHAPAPYRANGPLGHLDALYDAFGVGPGDKLYVPPERRVRIW
jgi:predicted metalloendopeptidase